MTTVDRKAAARAFRERVPVRGVFALRCAATGEAWVGPSRDLDAEEGRVRFFLRSGGHRDQALQQAYTTHGGEAFTFDVLERLDPDVAELNLADTLKARTAHRALGLGAERADAAALTCPTDGRALSRDRRMPAGAPCRYTRAVSRVSAWRMR